MKTTLKKSIRKCRFLLAVLSFAVCNSITIAQTSWNTSGNLGSFSNFIGTTNNYPFLFRTNNVERFRIQPNGFVGIGVANPTQRLDIFGNLRVRGNIYVDQNVYQQGQFDADTVDAGILNAGDITAAKVSADSIKSHVYKMDENSKFVGDSKFQNSVKIEENLLIGVNATNETLEKFEVRGGNAKFEGDVKLNQRLVFGDGDNGISFIPSNSSDATNSFLFGPPDNQYLDNPYPCLYPAVNTSVDFRNRIRIYERSAFNGGSRHTLSMFCDGANGNIDFAGTNGSSVGDPSLLINYYCGKDIHAVTGVNGGKLVVGKPQNNELAFNVRGNSLFEGVVEINNNQTPEYNHKLRVNGGIKSNRIDVLGPIHGDGGLTIEGGNVLLNGGSLYINNDFKIEYENSSSKLISNGSSYIFINSENNNPNAEFKILKNGTSNEASIVDLFKIKSDGTAYLKDLYVKGLNPQGRFPDFVFDKSYKLMPLKELQDFINDKKHLPGVVSEKTVKEQNGVSINDLTLILLQKLEENTLYILQQQNEIEALKVQLNSLQTKK